MISREYKEERGDEKLDDVSLSQNHQRHATLMYYVRTCASACGACNTSCRAIPGCRATFGMTIQNPMTRLWFCCRSSVIVSNAISIAVACLHFSLPLLKKFVHLNRIRSLRYVFIKVFCRICLCQHQVVRLRSSTLQKINHISLLFTPMTTRQTQTLFRFLY